MSKSYPYEFPTSGFARVDKIRHWLEDQPDWDYAKSETESSQYQDAAMELFHFPIGETDAEHIALNQYLSAAKAGRLMTIYAWGLYADLMSAANLVRPK